MVMVAKYILNELRKLNPKVIVVTDRVDLDKQINRTFNHTRLKAIKAATGNHLIKLIQDDEADIITTLVHKFDTASNKGAKLESRDIFVLVDESHRSQYKELHLKMKIFPGMFVCQNVLLFRYSNMSIDFGDIYRTMSEHFLNIANVNICF